MEDGTNEKGGGGMKSALEIALERTRDIKAGEDPNQLTAEQKERVKEINREYDAVIAKLEIDFTQRIRTLAEQHGEAEVRAHLEQFQGEMRAERARINGERQEKIREYMESVGK